MARRRRSGWSAASEPGRPDQWALHAETALLTRCLSHWSTPTWPGRPPSTRQPRLIYPQRATADANLEVVDVSVCLSSTTFPLRPVHRELTRPPLGHRESSLSATEVAIASTDETIPTILYSSYTSPAAFRVVVTLTGQPSARRWKMVAMVLHN